MRAKYFGGEDGASYTVTVTALLGTGVGYNFSSRYLDCRIILLCTGVDCHALLLCRRLRWS